MYFGKEVKVLLKDQAKECYLELQSRADKESRILKNSIERSKERLKTNPQYGNPIPKRLIPKEFLRIGIQNLYRVELSNFWRMLYTIEGDEVHIFLFILKIVDHNEYNKLFRYK